MVKVALVPSVVGDKFAIIAPRQILCKHMRDAALIGSVPICAPSTTLPLTLSTQKTLPGEFQICPKEKWSGGYTYKDNDTRQTPAPGLLLIP
jgi:hypothetical protein